MSRPVPLARTAVASVAPAHVELTRRHLAAGVPITLLLDLASGDRLDSRRILALEQVAAMISAEAMGTLRQSGESRERDTDIA
jgi:hypothetical protein